MIRYWSLICWQSGDSSSEGFWVFWFFGWEISLRFSHWVKYIQGFAIIFPLIFALLSIFLVVIRASLIKSFSKDWSSHLMLLTRSRCTFSSSLWFPYDKVRFRSFFQSIVGRFFNILIWPAEIRDSSKNLLFLARIMVLFAGIEIWVEIFFSFTNQSILIPPSNGILLMLLISIRLLSLLKKASVMMRWGEVVGQGSGAWEVFEFSSEVVSWLLSVLDSVISSILSVSFLKYHGLAIKPSGEFWLLSKLVATIFRLWFL